MIVCWGMVRSTCNKPVISGHISKIPRFCSAGSDQVRVPRCLESKTFKARKSGIKPGAEVALDGNIIVSRCLCGYIHSRSDNALYLEPQTSSNSNGTSTKHTE